MLLVHDEILDLFNTDEMLGGERLDEDCQAGFDVVGVDCIDDELLATLDLFINPVETLGGDRLESFDKDSRPVCDVVGVDVCINRLSIAKL